jgi:tRNA(Ile2) C34 agmatinyltransferase TiaS
MIIHNCGQELETTGKKCPKCGLWTYYMDCKSIEIGVGLEAKK